MLSAGLVPGFLQREIRAQLNQFSQHVRNWDKVANARKEIEGFPHLKNKELKLLRGDLQRDQSYPRCSNDEIRIFTNPAQTVDMITTPAV